MSADVVDNPEGGRFELHLDGQIAGSAFYRREEGRRVFTHTEIASEFKGKGLGGELARGALDQVREAGEEIVPLCPFIAGFIRKHREYAELVVPEMRARFA